MDPVGSWSAYATSYNRLAGVQPTPSGELHHHTVATPATTTAQLLPGTFLPTPPVGYETVFPPLFHTTAKPPTHYVTQHRQALAQAQIAVTKQPEGEYHQPSAFFDQNAGTWQQNGPFGILPHESVVATTAAKYESFNPHFATQGINHINTLAAKNASIRVQTPQVVSTTIKTQPNTTFFQVPTTESNVSNTKTFATTNSPNIQQSCIVTSSNTTTNPSPKEFRLPTPRTAFMPSPPNTARMDKPFGSPVSKPVVAPQIQTKAQTKVYPDINNHDRAGNSEEQAQQQNSPISFSIMDGHRINYQNSVNNNSNKRGFSTNYRHYQQSTNAETDFQRNKEFNKANGPDCNVAVPRRPSPLQAHSSPIGHSPSPVYSLYNSPMNSSPQNASNHVTPPSPLDVSVPRPSSQNNIAYPSVITRTLNTEKTFQERFDRPGQNQNCWDERRKYNNSYNAIDISRQHEVSNRSDVSQRQLGIPERQQSYFEANSQVSLQDLSSCRGDPMSIVKNLQQQQSCQVQPVQIKEEVKPANKRRKSVEKPISVNNDTTGRIPPPAHSSAPNQQPPQNGSYFELDRWNFPTPAAKIFTTQSIQQHQGLMVPHPHTHHPTPSIPYFHTPFHIPPHPPEFPQEMVSIPNNYHEQPQAQPTGYEPQEPEPKVVVPNIEEELNFLSEVAPARTVNRVPQMQMQVQKPVIPPTPSVVKPAEKPAGFMSSYLKFLQGERDSSPPPASRGGRKQTWSRSKPVNEIKVENNGGPPPPTSAPSRLSSGDPQDDPRYFPLPKERKDNSFNSSDDGVSSDDDLFNKNTLPPGKKDKNKKGRPCKPGGPTERKRAKQQAKMRKERKLKEMNVEDDLENVPRRETSKRAAKEKGTIKSLITKDDEVEEPQEFADSDSDPAWIPLPKEEIEEDVPLKKGKRGRPCGKKKGSKNMVTSTAQGTGIQENYVGGNNTMNLEKPKKIKASKYSKQGREVPSSVNSLINSVQQNYINSNSNSEEHPFKPGEFLVIKSELSQEWPAIWRVDGKTLLQKYEPFEQNGQTLYRNISTYTSWTPENRKQYQTVPVKYRSQSQLETIVEFVRSEMIIIDPEFHEKVMKACEAYQDNFEVYIQTLISQALDSNFLMEIFQEQDDYFLSNVKIIDDVTEEKKQKMIRALKWPHSVQVAVSTWPCFNVIRELSNNDALSKNCAACGMPGVAARVLMYGQPYNSTTLEGCHPDPKTVNEKDFIMCRICASRVELFNKVIHQKYLMYIDCAKRVADKRAKDPHKDTTCILNELLADEKWLTQLFAEVRSSWAEADSIEYSLFQKQRVSDKKTLS